MLEAGWGFFYTGRLIRVSRAVPSLPSLVAPLPSLFLCTSLVEARGFSPCPSQFRSIYRRGGLLASDCSTVEAETSIPFRSPSSSWRNPAWSRCPPRAVSASICAVATPCCSNRAPSFPSTARRELPLSASSSRFDHRKLLFVMLLVGLGFRSLGFRAFCVCVLLCGFRGRMESFWELTRELPKARLFATRIARRSTTLRPISPAVEPGQRPIPKMSQVCSFMFPYVFSRVGSKVLLIVAMLWDVPFSISNMTVFFYYWVVSLSCGLLGSHSIRVLIGNLRRYACSWRFSLLCKVDSWLSDYHPE